MLRHRLVARIICHHLEEAEHALVRSRHDTLQVVCFTRGIAVAAKVVATGEGAIEVFGGDYVGASTLVSGSVALRINSKIIVSWAKSDGNAGHTYLAPKRSKTVIQELRFPHMTCPYDDGVDPVLPLVPFLL